VRILYLYQYFVARKGHGMTRAYEFAQRLVDKGHDVTVVTLPGYLPAEYQEFNKITRVNIEGVPTVIIPVQYSNYMRFSRRIWAFIRFAFQATWICMRTPTDVIYASSGPLTIAFPAIIGRLWQRVPMVFEVRDLWPRMPIALGILKDPFTKAIARAMEWVAYHASTHVVALSEGMAAGVQERGIPASKITVIPNSSDVDLFDVPPETGRPIREKLGIDADTPLLVYAGSFGWMYKLVYVIDIAKAMRDVMPECRFLLVGAGATVEDVTTKARQAGLLDDTVFIWPPVPKLEMPAILSAATMTLSITMPIKEFKDNSANKFFDSLAAGRPMAINYGGWQAEILHETGAGIQIAKQDAALAAQQLADFIQQPDKLTHAQQAARKLAYERFDRDKMADKLEGVLKRVTET
jgi:glycosyltransferase involved in cell wall biosynthesis